MHSYYDAVVAIASMAAVGGLLAGVIADSQALATPMAAIALLLTSATFVVCRFGTSIRRPSRSAVKPRS